MLLLLDAGSDVGSTGSPERGRGMRCFVRHFAGARPANSPPRARSHPAQAEHDPPLGARPCPATLSDSATTGPCLANFPTSCHTVLAVYSRCAPNALPMYSSPRIGTPAQRLRRRVPAAGCIRPDAGAIGRQACQESTADGVHGRHGGLRSSADGVREGEAASGRMGGVKCGVAQARVGTAFGLGDRADPMGTSRTRILIV